MPFTIRPEKIEDYHAAEGMVRRAFFNRQHPGCNEHYLVHILRNNPDYLPEYSRIALSEGRIVGAIYYSKALIRTATGDVPIVTFGPLAVDPLFQGLGIGRALFEASLVALSPENYPAIAIYGEPNYYPKLGFHRAAEFGITDPAGEVYDPLMVYELRTNALTGIKGKLFESPVFEQVEDGKALAAFDALFPNDLKLKVPSQWLHETLLGRIEEVRGSRYKIRYWEILIEAERDPKSLLEAPRVGDYVTSRWRRNALSLIETLEIPK